MSFILFFVYYLISSFILICLLFILYKLFLKKYIDTKLSEKAILKAFDTFNNKSILDIDLDKINSKEEEDEKIPTYF